MAASASTPSGRVWKNERAETRQERPAATSWKCSVCTSGGNGPARPVGVVTARRSPVRAPQRRRTRRAPG